LCNLDIDCPLFARWRAAYHFADEQNVVVFDSDDGRNSHLFARRKGEAFIGESLEHNRELSPFSSGVCLLDFKFS
jgi:hypothetical protein